MCSGVTTLCTVWQSRWSFGRQHLVLQSHGQHAATALEAEHTGAQSYVVEVAVPLQGVELHAPLRGGRRGILHVRGGLAQQVVRVQQGDRNAGLVLPPALGGASRLRRGDCLQAPAALFSLHMLGVSRRGALWPVWVPAGGWIESGVL